MNIKHDKKEVLKTGLNLFCDRGYNSLGVDEICRVTGMTKGAFYNAFKSKEQFLIEALNLYGKNNVERIQSELKPSQHNSPLERLQNFYTQMLKAQPKVNYRGCFVNNIMAELGLSSDLVADISKEEYDKFIDAIVPAVTEAQKNGEIRVKSSARRIAELLQSTFYGALTIAKSSQDYKQSISTINLLFQNLKQV